MFKERVIMYSIYIRSLKSSMPLERFSEISDRANRGTLFMKRFSPSSSWILAVNSPEFAFDVIHSQAFRIGTSQLFSKAFLHLCMYGKKEAGYDKASQLSPPIYFGFESELRGERRILDLKVMTILWRAYSQHMYLW